MKQSTLLVLMMLALLSPPLFAFDKSVSIIANPSVSVNQLSVDEVKDIYLLNNRQWSDSSPIIVINRPSGSEIRSHFEQEILGDATKKYALHLERLHYQGIALPVIQESTQAVIAFVQNVRGAVAYIEGSPNNSQVKVLMELK